MPRLTITLPDELRAGNRDERAENREATSRRLGSGIEGTDDTGQRVLRWHDCWANSKP